MISLRKPSSIRLTLRDLLLATLITLGLILLFIFWPGDLRQYPLGPKDKLEYIGYEAGGCPEFLAPIALCSSKPYKTLYYATDMTPEEVVGYFSKAELRRKDGLDEKTPFTQIVLVVDSETIYLSFYNKKQKQELSRVIKIEGEKNIVGINAESYGLAKNSL